MVDAGAEDGLRGLLGELGEGRQLLSLDEGSQAQGQAAGVLALYRKQAGRQQGTDEI